MADSTLTGVLIGLLPGLSGAFVVYLRSVSKRRDAETEYLHTLVRQNTERLDHLENGGGTAKIKAVLSEVGAMTINGVYGRRSDALNAEQVPTPNATEHTARLIDLIRKPVKDETP